MLDHIQPRKWETSSQAKFTLALLLAVASSYSLYAAGVPDIEGLIVPGHRGYDRFPITVGFLL